MAGAFSRGTLQLDTGRLHQGRNGRNNRGAMLARDRKPFSGIDAYGVFHFYFAGVAIDGYVARSCGCIDDVDAYWVWVCRAARDA